LGVIRYSPTTLPFFLFLFASLLSLSMINN
jgi:hypothetical protein